MGFQAVVMAAGKGTRMKSRKVKVLHEVLGRTLLGHVIDYALRAGAERVCLILGHDRDLVSEWLQGQPFADKIDIALQEEQLGTGHAVWCARDVIAASGATQTVILSGDVPNLSAETLSSLIAQHDGAPVSLLTAKLDDPACYGRIVRQDDQHIARIVEYRDASEEERAIDEINVGVYVAQTDFLLKSLEHLMNAGAENAQGEFYLTDLVALANGTARAHVLDEPREMQGVNTRADLASATAFAAQRLREHWMREGVTMIDPNRVYLEPGVELASDVVLYPDVYLQGSTTIGAGTVIEHSCTLRDASVGEDAHIKASCYIHESVVGDGVAIGPFAHVRPGSRVGDRCKVGNFVELKKAVLDTGAKVSHLTYLGDANVGEGANIGAGTITCNYDGYSKHTTNIGARSFIGSNSALVAPVTIEDDAYVGAGSVITQNVPRKSLGVARGRQRNLEGWVERWRNQNDD